MVFMKISRGVYTLKYTYSYFPHFIKIDFEQQNIQIETYLWLYFHSHFPAKNKDHEITRNNVSTEYHYGECFFPQFSFSYNLT